MPEISANAKTATCRHLARYFICRPMKQASGDDDAANVEPSCPKRSEAISPQRRRKNGRLFDSCFRIASALASSFLMRSTRSLLETSSLAKRRDEDGDVTTKLVDFPGKSTVRSKFMKLEFLF